MPPPSQKLSVTPCRHAATAALIISINSSSAVPQDLERIAREINAPGPAQARKAFANESRRSLPSRHPSTAARPRLTEDF